MSAKRMLLVAWVVGVVLLAIGAGPGRSLAIQAPSSWPDAGEEAGTIPYTARLADATGVPVADDVYDFRFALYAAQSGGEPLWSEVQTKVRVWNGDLALRLGGASPIPAAVLGAGRPQAGRADLWLAVAVRGPGETDYTGLTPRQRLTDAVPDTTAGLTSGAACPHDHFGEEWQSGGNHYGLMVENTDANGQGVVGIVWSGTSAIGVRGWSYDGTGVTGVGYTNTGVRGLSEEGDGVHGEAAAAGKSGVFGENTGAGRGVYGYSAGGIGVVGHSDTGTGVRGEASSFSQAGVYGWNGGSGPGVVGFSSSGPALSAVGTGNIYSAADSVVYLSPHNMVAREENQSLISITPLEDGGVRVRNLSGTGTRYLSVPISGFGTLLGSQLYVKSLEVCYKAPAALTFISSTGAFKNNGSDSGWGTYLQDFTPRASTTYTCYPVNASTPRTAIDNSSWVQFNMSFGGSGSGWDIYIYTVELTLSESQS